MNQQQESPQASENKPQGVLHSDGTHRVVQFLSNVWLGVLVGFFFIAVAAAVYVMIDPPGSDEMVTFVKHQKDQKKQGDVKGATTVAAPLTAEQMLSSQPEISLTSTNGGLASYKAGSTVKIAWSQHNVSNVSIIFKNCPTCGQWLAYNLPVDPKAVSGSYDWVVPAEVAGGRYTVWISGSNGNLGSAVDESSSSFAIESATPFAQR
mgnify:CR=1 FL=1